MKCVEEMILRLYHVIEKFMLNITLEDKVINQYHSSGKPKSQGLIFWMKIAVKQGTNSQSDLCSSILPWAYNVQFSLNLGIKDTSNFEKCREDTFVKYNKQLKDLSEAHWWEQGSLVGWWRTMDKYWFISLDPTLLWNLQVQALELMDQQGT